MEVHWPAVVHRWEYSYAWEQHRGASVKRRRVAGELDAREAMAVG